jgi:hypothetical protein
VEADLRVVVGRITNQSVPRGFKSVEARELFTMPKPSELPLAELPSRVFPEDPPSKKPAKELSEAALSFKVFSKEAKMT